MNKKLSGLGLLVAMMFLINSSHADEAAVATAKGMIIADILAEKCTGSPARPNEMQQKFRVMQEQGFSEDDIRRGFNEGIIYAEGSYPRGKLPSKSECRDAIKLHRVSLRMIQ